ADKARDTLTSPYENVTNNQTVYIRVENEYGCVVTEGITLTLVVNPLPTLEGFERYEICDPDNDGFAEFDLDEFTSDIQYGQPNVEVSYHLTEIDAENGSSAINTSGPYENTKPDEQTIWVRAKNTKTGCINVEPLELIVVPSPEIQDLKDLYECEGEDGFAIFDLTENEDSIFGGQTVPDDVVITYHVKQSDAEEGLHPIVLPTDYTNVTNPQTIFVRVEDTITGCYDTFDYKDDNSFTLHVEDTPHLEDAYLTVCDDDDDQDPFAQTVLDMTGAIEDITGGRRLSKGQEIKFYANKDDLENDNPIANPGAYINEDTPQNIHVVVTNTRTRNNCSDEAILTLEVLP